MIKDKKESRRQFLNHSFLFSILSFLSFPTILNAMSSKDFYPKGIIIHSMAEYVVFKNKIIKAKDFLIKSKLSVHALINYEGEVEFMIPSSEKGIHAGKSQHKSLINLNQYYLGIELLIKGEHNYESFKNEITLKNPYSDIQLISAAKLCINWMNSYDININNIVKHSEVSSDKIRGNGKGKIDPGKLDWNKFMYYINYYNK